MFIQEIIQKKRDRLKLDREEIQYFIGDYTRDRIPDYQASALLMAMFLNDLDTDETVWLTEAMLHSGIVVDLSDIQGIKVDKHSTGGVGDKTSLIIAPICAALGIPVPMISGRGLGHTGGTLDKLESIPGFNVNLDLNRYRKLVKKTGLCLIGQTKEIAPADKKLYALRDVTATVEHPSLISASIMSKKLAEGIDALVLDVKTGSGAFMKTKQDSVQLAELMISIGQQMGKKVSALITDMSQPLGAYVGNALEVMESVDVLKGSNLPVQHDLVDLSLALASHMIHLVGKADNLEIARSMAQQTIDDQTAFKKLQEIVEQQGGDPKSLDDFSRLPQARYLHRTVAQGSGYIKQIDALSVGRGAVILGAGRNTKEEDVDPAVGIILLKKIGETVKKGETILEIHYNDEQKLENALAYFENSVVISEDACQAPVLIKQILGASDRPFENV